MYRARYLLTGLIVLALALGAIVVREVRRASEVGSGPTRAGGRIERCLACHDAPREDPGGVHAAEALGCSSCHLGNALAFDKARAHAGLEPEPGALETVARTCGQEGCHPREAERVKGSLMATGRGLVSVDRWAFGELPTPDGEQTLAQVLASPDPTPAEDHLRKLCAGCHLGARKDNRDDAILGAGSGCSACHAPLRLGDEAAAHPPVAGRVPDERCLGCHSRSGRISLSYQGLAEAHPEDPAACETPARLHDGRPACALAPDVHQVAGMGCVDCHLHTDLMGDGTAHLHAGGQVELTCESCHPRAGEATTTRWGEVDDPITRDLLRLRGEIRAPGEAVRTGRRGTPVWNLRPAQGGTWVLSTKAEGRALASPDTPADADHGLGGHERLTCQTCHAGWAPTCTTCHTTYDPTGEQWSFAAAQPVKGAWRETSETFEWGPPTLAVNAEDRIGTAVPGMIMELNARAAGGRASDHRLFAPLDPHTTAKTARTCEGCHLDPVVLGLGRGVLRVDASGVAFERARPDPRTPSLAQDRWTTLWAEVPGRGTRTGLRSLDAGEQHRVLRAGACLACHPKAGDPVYADFPASLARLRSGAAACPFPPADWLYAPPR